MMQACRNLGQSVGCEPNVPARSVGRQSAAVAATSASLSFLTSTHSAARDVADAVFHDVCRLSLGPQHMLQMRLPREFCQNNSGVVNVI